MTPPAEPGALARDVYRVTGEDRQLGPIARGARWVGTLVAGLVDVGDAPALSDIVITRIADGGEVRRIRESSVVEFEKTMRAIVSDLETLTPEAFAEAWLPA
ncbi:hypothetical protein [Microbacterium sp.]|uniref:hypothetical protein n=1 Tax=Microbacterium sp. TaxID=51671 RepID=UPI0037C9263A